MYWIRESRMLFPRIVALCVLLRFVFASDATVGRLSEGSSSTNSLSLTVELGGSSLGLNLDRTSYLDHNLPLYLIHVGWNGGCRVERAKIQTDYTMYQDREKGAAFMISTKTDQKGHTSETLEGLVHTGGRIYRIQTEISTDRKENMRRPRGRVIPEITDLRFQVQELNFSPADYMDDHDESSFRFSQPSEKEPTRHQRYRRQVTQDVFVDVVAMVDFGVYSTWYNRSTETTDAAKKQDALQKIQQYYAFVSNGIDLIYTSITTLSFAINVRFVGLIVAETAADSPWTEELRTPAADGMWDEVNMYIALDNLRPWVKTAVLPDHDHFMFFSGYDLTNGTVDSKRGVAGRSGVCKQDGGQTSIVEDLGAFQCIFTGAHELGHRNGRTCLYNQTVVDGIPDVTSQMPGQIYDVNDQCRQIFGQESSLCLGVAALQANTSAVCTNLWCSVPSTTSCHRYSAATGTTCGDKMWCIDGQCVYDDEAPAAESNCVFGDNMGAIYTNDNRTCADIVGAFSGKCYGQYIQNQCCASCNAEYRPVYDCEYGDRVTGCTAGHCSSSNNLQSCCGTCLHGDPITTTTTSTTTTTPTTTTTTTPPSTTTTTTPTTTTSSTTTTTTPTTTTTTTSPITTITTTTPTTTPTKTTLTATSTTTTTPTTTTTTTPPSTTTTPTTTTSSTATTTPTTTTTTTSPITTTTTTTTTTPTTTPTKTTPTTTSATATTSRTAASSPKTTTAGTSTTASTPTSSPTSTITPPTVKPEEPSSTSPVPVVFIFGVVAFLVVVIIIILVTVVCRKCQKKNASIGPILPDATTAP